MFGKIMEYKLGKYSLRPEGLKKARKEGLGREVMAYVR